MQITFCGREIQIKQRKGKGKKSSCNLEDVQCIYEATFQIRQFLASLPTQNVKISKLFHSQRVEETRQQKLNDHYISQCHELIQFCVSSSIFIVKEANFINVSKCKPKNNSGDRHLCTNYSTEKTTTKNKA